jgi:hypothetical protein
MTRGYVVITCEKKVKKYGYLNSDAYESWYGKRILQAIIDGNIDRYVDNIIKDNHACYGDEEPNPEFTLSWIRKDQSNKDWGKYDFCEYGYLYNENNGVLQVYNLGKLIYKISAEEREKYLYFFTNHQEIVDVCIYDPVMLDYNRKKLTRKIIESFTIDDMKKLVNRYQKEKDSMYVLDTGNVIAAGYTREYPCYSRILRLHKCSPDSGRRHCITFYVGKDALTNKWEVLVQLPFCRAVISSGYGSERSSTNALRSIIKENIPGLMRMSEIMDNVKECIARNDRDELHSLCVCLPELWKERPWYTARGAFSVEIIRGYYWKGL